MNAYEHGLTGREIELLCLALKYRKACEDSNPEVGMGPSLHTLCEDIVQQLSFMINNDDLGHVCHKVHSAR